MLQIVYACDRVLSPLDRIAILGTNHSTIYTFFPLERFIISMFRIQFHCGYLFYTTVAHTWSNLRRRKLNFESIKLQTIYNTIFGKLCIFDKSTTTRYFFSCNESRIQHNLSRFAYSLFTSFS